MVLERKDQDTHTKNYLANFPSDPELVVTDFELVVANAIKNNGSAYKTQSTRRKCQSLGIKQLYWSNDAVRYFIDMLDGVAFLDLGHVNAAITRLKNHLPGDNETSEMEVLLAVDFYFDETYVRGTTRPGFDAMVTPIHTCYISTRHVERLWSNPYWWR